MNATGANSVVAAAHEAHFASAPMVVTFAPGRVNLLGEHTDYNGGYVLPMALDSLGVSLAAAPDDRPGIIKIRSETFREVSARRIGDTRSGHWSDYILGCAKAVARDHLSKQGLRLTIHTTLPLGAGLSSSAALEVATLRALNDLYELGLSSVDIAVTARAVENDFVGVPCGVMDQFASSVGIPGQAIFLNTATLDYITAPSLPEFSFVIIDSGVSHQLSDGGYELRVRECREAARALGVGMLSELGTQDLDRIGKLPDPLNRRARHIVTDNALAMAGLAALEDADAQRFGACMIESHSSERDDYQITVPETDALVEAAMNAGAVGARQTGGGWGGSVVCLVPALKCEAVSEAAISAVTGSRLLTVS